MLSKIAPLVVVALTACGSSPSDTIRPDTSGTGASGPTSTSTHATQGAGTGGNSTAVTTATVGAGGSSGTGPGCCSQPIEVAGPVRTISAENDQTRLLSGVSDQNGKMVDGPFVVTDAAASGNPSISISLSTTQDCSLQTTVLATNAGDLHGMRVFVPAGMTACSSRTGMGFSGFKPY